MKFFFSLIIRDFLQMKNENPCIHTIIGLFTFFEKGLLCNVAMSVAFYSEHFLISQQAPHDMRIAST
jgi:hypothetical protein